MNAKVITCANCKGGVGKTTTTASIGDALAILGKKVLLIDLDSQQNLTFMMKKNEESELSVYDTLVRNAPLPIVNVRKNLDLVPASLDLARAELDMSSKIAREGILKSAIEKCAGDYDYILLDCSPSLGTVVTNALVASDKLFIPMTAEALPMKGLAMLDDVVDEVRMRVNSRLELGAVFFTRFSNRNLNKEVVRMVYERYGKKVFDTKIRENIALAEMPLSGKSIFEYSPKSNGAADYMALVEEMLSREANDWK